MNPLNYSEQQRWQWMSDLKLLAKFGSTWFELWLAHFFPHCDCLISKSTYLVFAL